MFWYFRSGPEHTRRELVAIGGLWMTLTVGFEFGFGHYVMGHSWPHLLADYDLLDGRLWVLIPGFLLLGPLLFGRSRGR